MVASTSQVKPEIPVEEDSQVSKAEAAMEEEKKETARESRLSGGDALNTKKEKETEKETQSAQRITRQEQRLITGRGC